MSDKFIRHLISAVSTFAAIVIYFAGYMSGTNGWWSAGFLVLVVYIIVYKLVHV